MFSALGLSLNGMGKMVCGRPKFNIWGLNTLFYGSLTVSRSFSAFDLAGLCSWKGTSLKLDKSLFYYAINYPYSL
jgi:hypothetical protein